MIFEKFIIIFLLILKGLNHLLKFISITFIMFF